MSEIRFDDYDLDIEEAWHGFIPEHLLKRTRCELTYLDARAQYCCIHCILYEESSFRSLRSSLRAPPTAQFSSAASFDSRLVATFRGKHLFHRPMLLGFEEF